MTILVTKWFGVFLCDEKSGKVLDKRLMPKDAHAVAEKLASVQRGSLLDEERELAATVAGKLAVADRRQYVSDPARLMSAAARDTVNALLARLEATTGIETAVVVLPSIGEAAPFDFAQSLFRHWGVGKAESDNGLLILYVGDQRKIRVHTGYGIEGHLTDAMGKRIQSRYMVPAFRRGDVSSGIVAGVGAVCTVLDGTMKPEAPADEGIGMAPIVMFIIILAVAIDIRTYLAKK